MKAVLAVSVLLYIECDPKVTVQGMVHDPRGASIAGAAVELRCPAASGAIHTITDTNGNFRIDSMGGLALDCVVQIRGGSGQVAAYQVAEVCRQRLLSTCVSVDIAAVLPVAAPSGTSAP